MIGNYDYDAYLSKCVKDYMTGGSYPDCDENCDSCDCAKCPHLKELYEEHRANALCDAIREEKEFN